MSYALLFLVFPHFSISPKSDCVAGTHWKEKTDSCEKCPSRYDQRIQAIQYKYSPDGAGWCTKCNLTGKRCLCDTTPPSVYWPSVAPPITVCNYCSEQCYSTTRYALAAHETWGRLQELADWVDCSCTNRSSCFVKNNITASCFLNDCDMPYEKDLRDLVSECFDEGVLGCNKTCYEALQPHLPMLRECNCHYTVYDNERNITCQKYKDFYMTCIMPTLDTRVIATTMSITFSVVMLVVLCFLGVKNIVSTDEQLKRKGNLAAMLPYIDWGRVEHIGNAKDIVKRDNNPFVLADREILLKVRFTVLNRLPCLSLSRSLKSEFIVLKVFANSRSVAQSKEVSVLSRLSNESAAGRNNVIKLHGSDMSNGGISEFLNELVNKSPNFSFLTPVISQYYLTHSTYMVMEHCNGLSLDHFIKTMPSQTLPLSLLLPLATDLANGLHHLHSNNPSIIHCDIKPQNIFVKKHRFRRPTFVLGDFGFSETHRQGQIWRLRGSTTAFLPPEWMISQFFSGEGKLSEEQRRAEEEKQTHPTSVDIYQLGLVMWLALHGKSDPWCGDEGYLMACRMAAETHNHGLVIRYIHDMFLEDFAKRPPFNFITHTATRCHGDVVVSRTSPVTVSRCLYEGLQDIVKSCWHSEVSQRISAAEVLVRLEKIKSLVSHKVDFESGLKSIFDIFVRNVPNDSV